MWRRGLFVCSARVLRVVLLSGAYCLWRISMFCRCVAEDVVGIFLVNSAEKCDLTRGVALFSDHMCCYCAPVHGNCGFWHRKLAAYLTGNDVALWVFPRKRKALMRYFRGSVWAF